VGRLKGQQAGPQVVDNIRGYHFSRTCWDCGQYDVCRCDWGRVTFRVATWYRCVECKIKRGELDINGYPLR
jgi:predicted RNA-binding Zn-ribbon protein involved in translation (DUF1610 family)